MKGQDYFCCTFPAAWHELVGDQFALPYMSDLALFLEERTAAGADIYPPESERFAAFAAVAPEHVNVVILGQDPYHGPGQAHGLSFSVPDGVRVPPSLRNIYKELEKDLGITIPESGNLKGWADDGVLLLNATLSVEQGKAGSHQKRGWEEFTDRVIAQLADRYRGIVFMLWGNYAISKAPLINADHHLLLTAPHPSPLSAHRGFLGCGHFSKANAYLQAQGREPVMWQGVKSQQLSLIS